MASFVLVTYFMFLNWWGKKENLHKGLAACLIEARCHVWGAGAKAEI